MVVGHVGSAVAVVAAGGGGDVLGWLSGKIAQVGSVLKGFSVVAAIGFVIFQALASRGAFARIVIAGLAAGVFVWIVWNVTNLRDRVGTEVNNGAAGRLGPARVDPFPAGPATLGGVVWVAAASGRGGWAA